MTRSTPSALSARSYSHSLVTVLFLLLTAHSCQGVYYGKLIGRLTELHHDVSGEVYAVDGRTLFLKNFNYNGEGPAAWFYVGNGKVPDGTGTRVRDEHGTTNVLSRYRNRNITLTLPEGKTLNNIKWFYLWCEDFSVNFGDVKIPRGFDYPRPQKLDALSGIHGVSSDPVVIVDAQTLLIPSFSYDGEAPDAKFWVGAGSSPSSQGIRVPDENGRMQPLRRYDHKTIVLTLPADLTVHQLGHFGVWCEAFAVDFGHVQIPRSLNVPPSLKMLGVSPQSKLNCEVLQDNLAFEVRWAVAGDSVVVQLVAKLNEGEYMSFGLSADPERSVMVDGDVVVAWVDKQTLQGYAIDYFLDDKSQCSGGRGSCPDVRLQENTNSVRLLNAAMVNGYSIVTYQRPLKASDELDRPIITNGSQPILWAIGPLNDKNEVSFHTNYLKTDRFIEFGRPPAWNCPMPDQEQPKPSFDDEDKESNQDLTATTRRPQRTIPTATSVNKPNAWEIPPIQCYEPDDGVFYAQMGPTGGKHGYPAITGHVGWGVSWYINGLLIPEIYVVRGRNYTFITEGGENPDIPAKYHPFYITDDPVGGYAHKTAEEKAQVKIFAGVKKTRGVIRPTGVGRLCNWNPDLDSPSADEFASFGAYQRTLKLVCDPGEPGFIQWRPDENTPDTVYYQCFTHRHLGWKIHVLDACDEPAAGSEVHAQYAEPNDYPQRDLDEESSIRVSSKVTPAPQLFQRNPGFHKEYSLQLHPYHHHYYPHYHPKTNPFSLSAHNMQLTRTFAPNNIHDTYERVQALPSEEHAQKLSHNPSADRPYANKDAHPLTRHGEEVAASNNYAENHLVMDNGVPHAYAVHGVSELEQATRPTNQLSKLVPDPRPAIMNYATMKITPPMHGLIPQTFLYSKQPQHQLFHQPHKTQLIFLRKPMRRHIIPSSYMSMPSMPNPTMMTLPSWPIAMMERKKALYLPPMAKAMPRKHTISLNKLMKYDVKPRYLDTKPSELDPTFHEVTTKLSLVPVLKKKKSGFDPASIVVEGGFKPILRNVEILREPDVEGSYDNVRYRPADNYRGKYNEAEDMEMVDAQSISYYSTTTTEPKQEREDENSTLKTYLGELPADQMPNHEILRTRAKNNKTRLGLRKRSKRSNEDQEEDYSQETWDFERDHTGHGFDHNGHMSYHPSEHRDDIKKLNYDQHRHEGHDQNHNLTLASAGQMILTNFEYIVVTIIFYYVL